ncbi:MAG: undecaprenyl/decaprenyl-phosphate alpha-N-acetylglucosaminyl 1-phosphate transferase, partial [Anaerolineales bacterium]|nr:undecaprenyl/decaprenyl-phosphate alpha-N-acetylglucosaminyl 1-phosphate transferase [Anaerolineales bacterium]
LLTGSVVAFQSNSIHSLIYLVCGAVIAYLGWHDDVHSLSPRVRFAVQGLVALASVLGMGYFKSVTIPLFGQLQLGAVGFIITILWIVGLTNAYNFMDGIDGIAGGVAFSAALGWMFLATHTNQNFVYWISLAVAAGSLGFLFHNWSPAKIFMGDVASTFLGYTFAVLPLLSADAGGDALMLGTLLMWTFIMDAGITFIRRALKRENVFSAHRTHLYQRLVIGGYKHAAVSLLYIFLTLLAGALAYAWSWGQPYAPPLIIIGLPLLWLILSRYVSRLRNVD